MTLTGQNVYQLLAILLCVLNHCSPRLWTMNINCTDSSAVKPLEHFWTSTGFSPPPDKTEKFLLSQDMELNIALIGAVPNRGITHVRVHWLLNLIQLNDAVGKTSKRRITYYSFKKLDKFLTWLHRQGLSPGFELMGNPSNYFHDFQKQMKQWTRLVHLILERYIVKFGTEYVRSWRFETLNEPDLEQYNTWNLTVDAYLAYIQNTSAALNDYGMKLWGPAGLFKTPSHHLRCWGARLMCLQHHETCPFSVISFHAKGEAVASKVVDRGVAIANLFNSTGLPLANDEADPLSGWWKSLAWRGDVRYAAAVVQIVIGHIFIAREKNININSISNDNAFMSYHPYEWTQRTLFARFQMNDSSKPYVEMFEKPVYTALKLLSLLGSDTLEVQYHPADPGWSMVSTSEGNRRTILIAINRDTLLNNTSHGWKRLQLLVQLSGYDTEARGVIYLLDNTVSNPWRLWKRAGSPDYPDKGLRRRMRQNKEPSELESIELSPNTTELQRVFKVRVPSVLLVNFCYDDDESFGPGPVTDLMYLNITKNEILLLWNDAEVNSRCLQTYIVEYRNSTGEEFQVITTKNFFTKSFHFDGCLIQNSKADCEEELDVEGEYRVAAMDYWERIGNFSDILTVP